MHASYVFRQRRGGSATEPELCWGRPSDGCEVASPTISDYSGLYFDSTRSRIWCSGPHEWLIRAPSPKALSGGSRPSEWLATTCPKRECAVVLLVFSSSRSFLEAKQVFLGNQGYLELAEFNSYAPPV